MDGAWLGDSLTLNIGECPREENVSLLSWILQADVPEKYYLSAKACRGILTRASRRGKKLQELLLMLHWEFVSILRLQKEKLLTKLSKTILMPRSMQELKKILV